VQLKDGEKINLPAYAARINIQLLKASDFNSKMRERGCDKSVTVQRICRIAKDENEVRKTIDVLWTNSSKREQILTEVLEKNHELYQFEKMLDAINSVSSDYKC
jgi:hypothetical protein